MATKSKSGMLPTLKGRRVTEEITKQRQAFLAALKVGDADDEGYALVEAQKRYVAAGGPLWQDMVGAKNFSWFAQNVGDASASGSGDERRWKYVGPVTDEAALASANARNLTARAQERVNQHIANLLDEHGATMEQIEATPSFQYCRDVLGLDVSKPGAKSTKAKSTRAKKGTSRRKKAASKS